MIMMKNLNRCIFSLCCIFLFASLETSAQSLKGAIARIDDLDNSYCSNSEAVDIYIDDDKFESAATSTTWTVYINGNESVDYSEVWCSSIGTSPNNGLRFDPSLVPEEFQNQIIVFKYEQYNGTFLISGSSDYTYVYSSAPVHNFGEDISICDGSSGILTLDDSENGFEYYLYKDGVNITTIPYTSSGGGEIDFSVSSQGTYTVVAVNSSVQTCTSTMNGSPYVTVNPKPSVSTSGNVSICSGLSTTVSATSDDDPDITYTWDDGSGDDPEYTGASWEVSPTTTTTYTVTATNNSTGCSASANVTVTVNIPSVPDISGDNDVCVNESGVTYTTESGMTNYVWDISGGIITGGDGTEEITVTWTTAGSGSVSVMYDDDNNCTSATPTVYAVNVNALPVPGVSGATEICLNESESYSTESGMSNYSWSVSGGTITSGSGTEEISVTWDTAGAGTVSVTYNDGKGCPSATPGSLNVTVYDLPDVTISGDNGVCLNETGVIYTTEADMLNYTWSVTGGTITSDADSNEITVTWTTTGSQTVSVNYQDENTCSATSATTYNVNVHDLPVVSLSGDNDVCLNETGVTYTTEADKKNYIWSVSGGTITSGENTNQITVTWETAGSGSVSVSYEDTNDCAPAVPTSLSVFVNSLPEPSITGASNVCAGTINETYSTESGMGSYVWTVSGGGVITSGQGSNTIDVNWPTAGAGNVTVTYEDGKGCSPAVAASQEVTIHSLPVISITGDNDVCLDGAAVTYTTESGMSNYTWSVTGGNITSGADSNQITVVWTNSGSQTVSVNYNDENNCSAVSDATLTVEVHDLPVPTLSGDDKVCLNETGITYTTDTNMDNYSWTVIGGTITSGATTNQITVTWNTAGSGSVSVSYEDDNDCTPSLATTLPVTVFDLPVPTITGDDPICVNGTGTYTTESGMTSYIWTVSSGGSIVSGGGTNEIMVDWTTTGTKTITVSYYNTNGCQSATPSEYTVEVTELPEPTISGDNTVCLNSADISYTTETGMDNYVWTVSSGGIITSGQGTESILVTWNASGAQNVTVTYDDKLGCSAAGVTSYNVLVNTLPTPGISGNKVVCSGSEQTYSTETDMSDYEWTVTGGTIVSGEGTNSINIQWTTSGSQTVGVNYVNKEGCKASTPSLYSVTVNELPVPVITGDDEVCINESDVSYSTEAGKSAYNWTITGGVITSGQGTESILVTWNTSGSQSVSVSYVDENNCASNNSTVYTVDVKDLPVPTIDGDFDVCQGSEDIIYSTEMGMSNYVWTVSSGGTITSGAGTNEITVDWNASGTQTVSVIYDDTNSCGAATATVENVTVYSLPIISLNGENSVCFGSTESYTTETDMTQYDWNVTGGTIVSGDDSNSIMVQWNTSGAQTISVNYVNQNGCSAATDAVLGITVNDLPVPKLTGNNVVCINETGVVYTTDSDKDNYVWTITGGTIDNGQGTESVSVTWDESGEQTISVNYEDPVTECAAANAKDYTVTVHSIDAVLNITAPDPAGTTVCSGTEVTYNAVVGTTSVGSGDYSYEYLVDGVPQASVVGSPSVFQIVITSDVTVSVTITDNIYGCSDTQSISMTALSVPTVSLASPVDNSEFCKNEAVTLEASPAGYASYVFYGNDGSGDVILSSGSSETFDKTDGFTSDMTLYVIAGQGSCSSQSSPVSITVNELPEVELSCNKTTACENEDLTFTATGSGSGTLTYEFLVNDISQGTPETTNTFVTSSADDFSVKVIIRDENCEYTSDPVDITISKPVATLIADKSEVCANEEVLFTAGGGDSYEWYLDDVVIPGETNSTYSTTLTGSEEIKVQVTDEFGCSNVATSSSITVNPVPVVSISSSDIDNTICQNDEVTFTADGGDVYEFFVNNVSVQGPDGNDTYVTTTLNDGDEVYAVVINGSTGCSVSTSIITTTVHPLPVASLTVNPSMPIVEGTELTFTAGGGDSYEFYVNSSLINGTVGNIYTTNELSIGNIVSVKVFNDATGCYSYSSITITGYDVIVPLDIQASATDYCAGDGGVTIFLNGTPQNGVTYELVDQDYNPVQDINGDDVLSITYDVTAPSAISWSHIGGTATYTVIAYYDDVDGSTTKMNGEDLTITENPLPQVFNLSPDEDVTGCNGGDGVHITLDESEAGVNYTLLLNGVLLEDTERPGDGNIVDFGNQMSFGDYTVQAQDVSTGCSIVFDDEFSIISEDNYDIFQIEAVDRDDPADGRFCSDNPTETGVSIALNNSTAGVEYYLVNGGEVTDIHMTGTGESISFSGPIVTEGTYTVVIITDSGCQYPMDGSVVVTAVDNPQVFNLEATNSGHYCEGDDGVTLWLDNQQENIIYHLYQGDDLVDTQIGSLAGSILQFDGIYTSGVYSVQASVPDIGCSSNMNSITVQEDVFTIYDVTCDNTEYCEGGSTEIYISGSETNDYTQYYLVKITQDVLTGEDVRTRVDGPTNADGRQISFAVSEEGLYGIDAINTIAGCETQMNGSILITVKDLPDSAYGILRKLDEPDVEKSCSIGDSLYVFNVEEGVEYTLVKYIGDEYVPVSGYDPISGTEGTDIGFERVVDTKEAHYNVLAIKDGCEGVIDPSADVIVNIENVVQRQLVTGVDNICNGDPGVIFGLEDTEENVDYTLYFEDGNPVDGISVIHGNGEAQNFDQLKYNFEGEYYVWATLKDAEDNIICELEMLNRKNLIIHPLPVAFTMFGSGQTCDLQVAGALIGLPQYEDGYDYQLQMADSDGTIFYPVDDVTGIYENDSIKYTVHKEGRYRIIAISDNNCTSEMNSYVTVVSQPDKPNSVEVLHDELSYCSNSNGVSFSISDSQSGVTYQMIDADGNVVKETVSSGGEIVLGTYGEGTYTVVASWGGDACKVTLKDSDEVSEFVVTVAAAAEPRNILPTEDVTICGSESTFITLEDPQANIEYQLVYGGGLDTGIAYSEEQDENGNDILVWEIIGDETGAEIYEVLALPGTDCELSMGTVLINALAGPDEFTIISDDNKYCSGDDGVSFGVRNPESGIYYWLVDENDDSNNPIDVIYGKGGTYDAYFNQLCLAGSYNVIAKSGESGCDHPGADSPIIIEEVEGPDVMSREIYCTDESNTISSECVVDDALCIDVAEEGVDYYLYKEDDLENYVAVINVLDEEVGNTVCFNPITEEGNYIIEARSTEYPYCSTLFTDPLLY